MNRFTPLFSQIVDSSIWDEDDKVCKVWVTLLSLKDSDHVVRKTTYAIARASRKTEEEADRILKVLSEPDTKRKEKQEYEGRRIEKVEDGWLILNGQYYEDMMRKISEQARKARWARDNRSKLNRSNPLSGEAAYEKELEKNGEASAAPLLPGEKLGPAPTEEAEVMNALWLEGK